MDCTWLGIGMLVCGFLGAAVASSKNRAGTGLILGMLLGPIGVVVAALLGDASRKPKARPTCATCGAKTIVGATRCPACGNDPQRPALPVTCPACKGVIQPGDPACPHCGAARP